MNKVGGGDPKNSLYCSFCGKSQHEVRKLIPGPTVSAALAFDGAPKLRQRDAIKTS